MNPIPTEYKGTMFRSRLEARYAQAFDLLGMKWSYETIGLDLNGTKYLPDFWLPESRTFFEVKGPHKERIESVKRAQTINNPEFDTDKPMFIVGDEVGAILAGGVYPDIFLSVCTQCQQRYFRIDFGSWQCRCCAYYDGDGTYIYDDDLTTIELPQMQWQPKGAEDKEARMVSRIVDEVMQRITK